MRNAATSHVPPTSQPCDADVHWHRCLLALQSLWRLAFLCVCLCMWWNNLISEPHHASARRAYNAYNAYRCPLMRTHAYRRIHEMRGSAFGFSGGAP